MLETLRAIAPKRLIGELLQVIISLTTEISPERWAAVVANVQLPALEEALRWVAAQTPGADDDKFWELVSAIRAEENLPDDAAGQP